VNKYSFEQLVSITEVNTVHQSSLIFRNSFFPRSGFVHLPAAAGHHHFQMSILAQDNLVITPLTV